MRNKRRGYFFLLGFCVALAALLCGCVDRNYREADAATFDAVAGEYLEYVEEDDKLTADQKQTRLDTILSWKARLDAWKDD